VEGDQRGNAGMMENALKFWAADVEGRFVHDLQAGAGGHEIVQRWIDDWKASFHARSDLSEFVSCFVELVEELRGRWRFLKDERKSGAGVGGDVRGQALKADGVQLHGGGVQEVFESFAELFGGGVFEFCGERNGGGGELVPCTCDGIGKVF